MLLRTILVAAVLAGLFQGNMATTRYRCRMDGTIHATCCCDTPDREAVVTAGKKGCCDVLITRHAPPKALLDQAPPPPIACAVPAMRWEIVAWIPTGVRGVVASRPRGPPPRSSAIYLVHRTLLI